MLSKKFVSLSFSSKVLQVLQLDSKKKKAIVKASINLPEGLIVNHKVQDKGSLAVVLKNIWKKYKIKERAVGIVVPEFSTFIKNLTLPKLGSEELSEAVLWQSHDFLPINPDKMSMDWRITKELDNNHQVLVLAIERDTLAGYVDAAALAGLFPLVVETPSLSLVRAANTKNSGRLIIYGHYDEYILVVADGEKILGSSVVDLSDKSELLNTSMQIAKHYKDVKLGGILVGGMGIEPEFISKLETSLKIKISKLSTSVSKMTNEEMQQYLIPTSLQYKEPTDPSDEETINLLPKTQIAVYEQRRFKVQLWSLLMLVTFLVWSSFFAALGVYVFTLQQVSVIGSQGQVQLNKATQTKEARDQIKKINDTSTKVLNISTINILPQTVLNPIYQAKPNGVTISEYKLDLELGSVVVKGKANTRNDLIDFKKNLENNKDFIQISIPISSFEVETDLDFGMSFIYLPSTGKKAVERK